MANVRTDAAHLSPIPPPKQRRKYVKVRRAVPGSTQSGICVHQEVIPCLTHWHEAANGKVRCTEGREWCPWCDDGQEARWYGFMPVLVPFSGKVEAFEITHQAALDCPQLSSARIPLRGRLMILARCGNSKHGRASVRIEDNHFQRALPPQLDPADFLEGIFEIAEAVPYVPGPPKWEGGI